MEKSNLRVATYNIHRGVGIDGKMEMNRITTVLKEINADVVGIQEIDSHCITEEGHQLNFIAKETGYKVIAGPTLLRADTEYGNAFLTRFPIKVHRRLDLTVGTKEPRGALDVDLDVRGEHFRIISTHLGLGFRERRYQLSKLFKGIKLDRPLIVLGDMNEWIPFMGATRIFRANFGFRGWILTYPSRFPIFGLDQIYVSPRKLLSKTWVHKSKLSRVASDHLPVVSDIELHLVG